MLVFFQVDKTVAMDECGQVKTGELATLRFK